jgi:predicted TIM-barrel fold metal-dependent hydrolase
MHIYDGARFPPPRPQSRMQPNACVPDYRMFQQRIGTSRVIVVTPAAYFTDNEATLDALEQFGPQARGVAVVHPNVSDAELKRMDRAGIRGIRFTQFDPNTATTTMDMIEPLAKRVQTLGWHVQIHLRADQVVAAAEMLLRLPGTIVFDHLGRLVPPEGLCHPAFDVLCRMFDNGRTWMKLSGAYFFGAPQGYAAAGEVARACIGIAPERMVWGSDWPHPTEKVKPDDAVLFDLLSDWAPDAATRQRILVDNPAKLYGFG